MSAYALQATSPSAGSNTDRYAELRRMDRPVPYRPRMPRQNRAKIFAPYDALKPFEKTVHAKETVYARRVELSDYAQEQLDQRLRLLRRGDTVSVTWFQYKGVTKTCETGLYVTSEGQISKIDHVYHVLHLGKQRIPIPEILELRGEKYDSTGAEGTAFPDFAGV